MAGDETRLRAYGSSMRETRCARGAWLGLLLIAMTGCGGASTAGSATPRPTVTVTATVTATPSPSAAPTSDSASPLGQEWQAPQGNRIKVLEYRQGAPGAYAVDGERWDAVLVKTCVGNPKGAALSWLPWRLLDADAGQYEASGETSGDFLAPQYPFAGDRTVAQGQCVKGWIYFGVPKDGRLRQVNYANDAGETHAWRLRG
jgi:hypothetical protein